MMSAKMASPGLLKITVFWNKDYDVIISVDDVTNKILSRDSNYIVDVFMRLKFGNYSISMREVITTSIVIQPLFLRGGLGSSSITRDWH